MLPSLGDGARTKITGWRKVVDGYHAARLARSVREYLEDPKRFEPDLG